MQVRFLDTDTIRAIPAREPEVNSYFSISAIFGSEMEVPEDIDGYTMELGASGWVANPVKEVFFVTSIPTYWIVRYGASWFLVPSVFGGWERRKLFAPQAATINRLEVASPIHARCIGIPGRKAL